MSRESGDALQNVVKKKKDTKAKCFEEGKKEGIFGGHS